MSAWVTRFLGYLSLLVNSPLEKEFTSPGSVSPVLAPPTTFICRIIVSWARQISSVFCSDKLFVATSQVPLNPEFRK